MSNQLSEEARKKLAASIAKHLPKVGQQLLENQKLKREGA